MDAKTISLKFVGEEKFLHGCKLSLHRLLTYYRERL